MRTTRILTVIIDGHYTTINSTRTGYHKVKGYAKNTDVDHATIKQDERHYTTVILMGLSIMQWSNGTKMSHYTTINLMRTWDGTRRSIMLRIGRQGFTQQLTWWGWGILWGEVTCEVEWQQSLTSPHYATINLTRTKDMEHWLQFLLKHNLHRILLWGRVMNDPHGWH